MAGRRTLRHTARRGLLDLRVSIHILSSNGRGLPTHCGALASAPRWGSCRDDLEGKEVETISDEADRITYNDLTGEDKEWHPISNAPADRELEVRLEDSFGRYVLLFPCKFVPDQGWINSRLETPLRIEPVDWRYWDELSIHL